MWLPHDLVYDPSSWYPLAHEVGHYVYLSTGFVNQLYARASIERSASSAIDRESVESLVEEVFGSAVALECFYGGHWEEYFAETWELYDAYDEFRGDDELLRHVIRESLVYLYHLRECGAIPRGMTLDEVIEAAKASDGRYRLDGTLATSLAISGFAKYESLDDFIRQAILVPAAKSCARLGLRLEQLGRSRMIDATGYIRECESLVEAINRHFALIELLQEKNDPKLLKSVAGRLRRGEVICEWDDEGGPAVAPSYILRALRAIAGDGTGELRHKASIAAILSLWHQERTFWWPEFGEVIPGLGGDAPGWRGNVQGGGESGGGALSVSRRRRGL
jgi:hypothetical protein